MKTGHLAPGKRPGYRIPPKVAASVSVSPKEAAALTRLLMGLSIVGRRPSAAEVRALVDVTKRGRKSLEYSKAKRAAFDREKGSP